MNIRRLLMVLLLGFSSGLPFNLTSKTLQAWLSSLHVDPKTIALLGFVALPYSLKFLWAPLLDRFPLPFLGRRRGWLLASQVVLGVLVLVMANLDPRLALQAIAVTCVLISIVSATQDLAFDAWKVDLLPDSERGTGASLGVLGYRFALLVTGSLALYFAPTAGWKSVYLQLAGLQLVLVVATFASPEPTNSSVAPRSLRQAVVEPFLQFVSVRTMQGAALALGFVAFFKWGVYLVAAASTTFLVDKGFTLQEIGKVQGGYGLIATILGTACGGLAMAKLSVHRALWIFGVLQGACGLLFWQLSRSGPDMQLMVAAVTSESFFVGMGSAAMVAWMLGQCDSRFSATQFALLSSLMAFSRDVLPYPWGGMVVSMGWSYFFLATLLACLPGLALLAMLQRQAKASPQQAEHA